MILVFDLDGTLVKSKKLYAYVIHDYLKKRGYGFSRSRISNALGPKLKDTLLNLGVPENALEKFKKGINYEAAKKADGIKLCPYAKRTLIKLKKGNKIILLTNSPRKYVDAILRKNKLNGFFDLVLCEKNTKDKVSSLTGIAGKYKAGIKEIYYIADKVADVRIARKAGCRIIIVKICSWDRAKFSTEKFAVKSLRQIPEKLSLNL